jgi:hypothetical protein
MPGRLRRQGESTHLARRSGAAGPRCPCPFTFPRSACPSGRANSATALSSAKKATPRPTRRLDRSHQVSLLGEIATQARRRGERAPNGAGILGPLADLFEYQYGPANKAVATRAKRTKAARANATPGAPKSTPTP